MSSGPDAKKLQSPAVKKKHSFSESELASPVVPVKMLKHMTLAGMFMSPAAKGSSAPSGSPAASYGEDEEHKNQVKGFMQTRMEFQEKENNL